MLKFLQFHNYHQKADTMKFFVNDQHRSIPFQQENKMKKYRLLKSKSKKSTVFLRQNQFYKNSVSQNYSLLRIFFQSFFAGKVQLSTKHLGILFRNGS